MGSFGSYELFIILRLDGVIHNSRFSNSKYSVFIFFETRYSLFIIQLPPPKRYTYNIHGDARIEGYHYCMPLETLLALNYNSFILTVGIIGVDSHARYVW